MNIDSMISKEVGRGMNDAGDTTRLLKTENPFVESELLYLSKTDKSVLLAEKMFRNMSSASETVEFQSVQ